ncbi:Uma2 family endonuclease [Altericista sp. CCNU0014]|uniref:Uma2 family endonuclease n=1 Tax=Altericista sp. CCNU0014 TaxID=3082949 RepID=UPI00384C5BE9
MVQALPAIQRSTQSSLIEGVSWESFEAIEAAFSDVAGIRLAYLDGVIEFMPISNEHEELKSTIGRLLEVYLRAKGIRYYIRGGPSLGTKEDSARRQPDESYNIGSKKDRADIAIEVVLTSGGVDKLESYRRFGVPEVWFWQDGSLRLYALRDESYQQIFVSQFLPNLDLGKLVAAANLPDQYDAVTEYMNDLSQES